MTTYKEAGVDIKAADKAVEEIKTLKIWLGNNFNFTKLLDLFETKPDLLNIVEPVIEKWKKNYSANLTDTSINT